MFTEFQIQICFSSKKLRTERGQNLWLKLRESSELETMKASVLVRTKLNELPKFITKVPKWDQTK